MKILICPDLHFGKNIAGENEIRVLNPDKLITKSQLTEIWNKANNK